MNNISNNSNQSSIYFTKYQWFELFGLVFERDIMCLFINLPISFIGFILNILSYAILSKKAFEKVVIYSYMRMYTLNSIIINLVSIFLFTANSNYYFEFSYASAIPSYFLSYAYIPIINICMFFAILIEIVITIERISNLKLRFRSITRQKPKHFGIIFLLASLVINVQYFFNQEPTFVDLKLNSTAIFRINYIQSTAFSLSLTGIILNFCTYFIRDVILLVLQCFLSIYSMYLIKNYFKNKRNIFVTQQDSNHNKDPTANQISNIQSSSNPDNLPKTSNSESIHKNITKADHNLTIMIVIMTFLSILEHFLLIFVAVFLFS